MISSFMLSQFAKKLQHLQRQQINTLPNQSQKQTVVDTLPEKKWMVVHQDCSEIENGHNNDCQTVNIDKPQRSFRIGDLQIVRDDQTEVSNILKHLKNKSKNCMVNNTKIDKNQSTQEQCSLQSTNVVNQKQTINNYIRSPQNNQRQGALITHWIQKQSKCVNQQGSKSDSNYQSQNYMTIKPSAQNVQQQQSFEIVNPLDSDFEQNAVNKQSQNKLINTKKSKTRSLQQKTIKQLPSQQLNKPNNSNSHKKRKPHKSMVQQLKSSANPQCLPYLYSCNNFIILYQNSLPAQVLKLYLLQISTAHLIPYNKCLIYFAIQCVIYSFYKSHHIDCPIQPKYITDQIGIMLPQLISKLHIRNWYVLLKIVQGLFMRFKVNTNTNTNVDQYCVDDLWLFNIIKKNRRRLKQNNVDVDTLLNIMKKQDKIQPQIRQQPTNQQKQQHQYTTIKQYLANHTKLSHLLQQLQEQNYGQLLQCSVKQGVKTNLKYYRKLKGFIQSQQQEEDNKTLNGDLDSDRLQDQVKIDDDIQGIISESQSKSYNESEFQLTKIKSKCPQGASILQSEQELFQQDESAEVASQISYKSKVNKKKQKQNFKKKQSQKSKKSTIRKTCAVSSSNVINMDTIQQLKEEQIIRALDLLEKQPVQPQVNSNEQRYKAVVDPTPKVLKHKKQKRMQYNKHTASDPEILVKMDHILYQFYLRCPSFSMQMLEKQIGRILGEQLKVPHHLHSEITKKWFNIYKHSR